MFVRPEIYGVSVGNEPEEQHSDGGRPARCNDEWNARPKNENVASGKPDQGEERRTPPCPEQTLHEQRQEKNEHENPMSRLHPAVAPGQNDERRCDKSKLGGFANVAAVIPAAAVSMSVSGIESADIYDSDNPC